MTTTLGQLIADLYDAYEARACDPQVAALATAAIVNDLLCEVARRDMPARIEPPGRTLPHHEHA
jgi:hypothetical protein